MRNRIVSGAAMVALLGALGASGCRNAPVRPAEPPVVAASAPVLQTAAVQPSNAKNTGVIPAGGAAQADSAVVPAFGASSLHDAPACSH